MSERKPADPVVLDRRTLLRLTGQGIGLTSVLGLLPGCGGGSSSGSSGGGGPLPVTPLELHVAKRTSFGATDAQLALLRSSGIEAYIDAQLDYLSIDASAVEAEVASRYPRATQDYATLAAGFPGNFQDIVADLVGATLLRNYFSPRQLYEVMVEFWSNHFSVHLVEGIIPLLKPTEDANVIRAHALGNFADLLNASARSPAMLYYLDNYLNFAGEPQENYARELLELHTIGVGNFTEDDVKEVARCFTGWTFNNATGEFTFVPFLHDDDAKTVLGTPIPAGGGISDGETVLALLAASPDTARLVCTKLGRRFVADDPPAALIDAMVGEWLATDGDIAATLRVLFTSTEFEQSLDAKLARPMEFMGQLARGLTPAGTLPDRDTVQLFFLVLTVLGQVPFYWVPPNGYPDVNPYWASTSGFLNRWRIAIALNDSNVQAALPVAQLAGSADTLTTLVDAVTTNLLRRELSAADRTLVIDWLVDELSVGADQVLDTNTINVLTPFVTAMLVSSAYFQLR